MNAPDPVFMVAVALLLLYAAWRMGRNRWSSYEEYLRSPTWRRKREAAKKRDGFRCKICNHPARLEVHHRRYPKVIGTESVNDLVTLCSDCHEHASSCPWVPGHRSFMASRQQ